MAKNVQPLRNFDTAREFIAGVAHNVEAHRYMRRSQKVELAAIVVQKLSDPETHEADAIILALATIGHSLLDLLVTGEIKIVPTES